MEFELQVPKSFEVTECKTSSKSKGEFTASISVFGNVDSDGDRVVLGAFEKAIESDPPPPVVYAHKWDIPPIGETLEWKEDRATNSLIQRGKLFVDGDDSHQFAQMVYAGMKSRDGRPPALRNFSYTYGIPEGGAESVFESGKSIRELHEIRPVIEAGPCLVGANRLTGMIEPAKGYLSPEAIRALEGVALLTELRPGAKARVGVTRPQADVFAKAYEDIEGYSIRLVLSMLDDAVAYIQNEEDGSDIATMKTVASTLLGLLRTDFADANIVKSLEPAIEYAAKEIGDVVRTESYPSTQEIRRLQTARPRH